MILILDRLQCRPQSLRPARMVNTDRDGREQLGAALGVEQQPLEQAAPEIEMEAPPLLQDLVVVEARMRDVPAQLQGFGDLVRQRNGMGLAKHRLVIGRRHQLGRAARRRGDERNAADGGLIDRQRGILDRRRHHRQAVAAQQIFERVVLLELAQDLDLGRPVGRLRGDIVHDVLVGTRHQSCAGLAHERDLRRQLHVLSKQALDGLHEGEETLARFQPTEEDDLVDRMALAPRPVPGGHQLGEMIEGRHVGLNEGPVARNAVALARHPAQQMKAAADHDVGELDAASFGVDLRQVVDPVERLRTVEPVPDPGRRGLDDEQGFLEREALTLRQQAQVPRAAPFRDVHHVHRMVGQVFQHVVGGVQPAVGAGLEFVRRGIIGNRHELDGLGRVEVDPLFDRAVLDLVSLEVEDRHVVPELGEQFGEGRIGRPDAAVADGADDVFRCNTNTQPGRFPLETGQSVETRKLDRPRIGGVRDELSQNADRAHSAKNVLKRRAAQLEGAAGRNTIHSATLLGDGTANNYPSMNHIDKPKSRDATGASPDAKARSAARPSSNCHDGHFG